MAIKFTKLFLLALIISTSAFAQDIHFTQYNASPLSLNPALTGNFSCTYRGGINYRNQWNSVTTPYVTYSAFFDMPVLNIGSSDVLGAGLYIFNDKSGDGNLSNLSVLASAAYHKGLFGGDHSVSLGIQMGLSRKQIDQDKLYFGNQFDGTDFDQNLPSNEPFGEGNFNNFDFNAGLVWKSAFSSEMGLEAGVAFYHLTTPKETFFTNNSDNDLGMRYVFHSRFKYAITSNIAILPTVLFMSQTKAMEANFGSEVNYYLDKGNFAATIIGGLYYRWDDAVIMEAGIDYKNFRFAFSYDVNTSSLTEASNGKGAFELSLIYKGCILPVAPTEFVMPCPRY